MSRKKPPADTRAFSGLSSSGGGVASGDASGALSDGNTTSNSPVRLEEDEGTFVGKLNAEHTVTPDGKVVYIVGGLGAGKTKSVIRKHGLTTFWHVRSAETAPPPTGKQKVI